MLDVPEIIARQHAAAQKGLLSLWTVYDHPKDFPEGYIARRFEVGGGKDGPMPTDDIIFGALEDMRATLIDAGLTRLLRHANDEPQIVECWV